MYCETNLREDSRRVFNNSTQPIDVLDLHIMPKSSLGVDYKTYLRLTNDDLGKSLIDAEILVVVNGREKPS